MWCGAGGGRGTFSKTSRTVTGRRPFERDWARLNYDYDSEAEWEEEDPDGKSCPALCAVIGCDTD